MSDGMSYHEDATPDIGRRAPGTPLTVDTDGHVRGYLTSKPASLAVLDVTIDERERARDLAARLAEQLFDADAVLDLLAGLAEHAAIRLPAMLEHAAAEYRARWK